MARFLEVRYKDEITLGEPSYPFHLLICGGTACHASKSIEIKIRLENEIVRRGLQEKVLIIETGCNGFCAQGPIMVVYPGGIFYQYLKPEDAGEIIEQHILQGYPVERLMYRDQASDKVIPFRKDIPFFSLQESRVLRNRGLIAAESIEEYIGTGGYAAASKVLIQMSPSEIVAEVKESGLRGRGGAGFPTGLKWEFAARARGDVKYILCNADEGDPGAFMDRSVLEADPHAVLEGMIIAAKAIGAHQGYIYCRAEYPLAVKRLAIAIDQARQYGLLGRDVLGSGFDFDLEIYRGAGAFVCGEETALMTSIEGKRGMPRPRPPFPAIQGLWKKPTVLNNVETLASIPQIILNGGKWYASLGTARSKGTKIFALTGDIYNVGLVEVPMGTSLENIITDIAGGISEGKRFKAAQLGGPSGGCIPAQHLDALVDYESITQLGAIVGSGGMIVMDEDKCMVDVARFFMEFCMDESCGKCTPCRVGTGKMLEILTRICEGNGKEGDVETLERWAAIVQNTALCGLGQTAPNPVLSTLRYFRNEYEAHIHEKRCSAGVCRALVAYHALEDKCLPCLEAVAGYDAGGYEGLKTFLPELVPERLVTRIQNSGCAVDLARYSMIVPVQNKSCTKCAPCRLGAAQMLSILNDIATGNGKLEMLDLLFELIDTMKVASECPVGKTGPDIVLFTLEHFRDQFEAHILEKACLFGICTETVRYHTVCPLRANETD
jgi:NADH:ubiquinone oxidoreductase subunit F (NADH-binding)/(2Fe-2S) ferredoxin